MKCQTLHLQRVIASTQSDLYGALTGAVASLKGSLHGGANEAVMYMLLEAGNVEKFEELLQKKLYNKEKNYGLWTPCIYEEDGPKSTDDEGSFKAVM